MQEIESNSVVFAGPFLGEFGWELSHWAPHVRWLRAQYPGRQLYASSYPGRQPIYNDFIDKFVPLPEWFTNEKHDLDCFESLCAPETFGKLTLYFDDYIKSLPYENVIWTRTPRGFNKIIRKSGHTIFEKLKPSESAKRQCDQTIANFGNKPIIILFAREVERKKFLDIVMNQVRHVEDLKEPLPTRNWPRSYWEDLFEMLYKQYSKNITFAIGGTKGGNCLTSMANKYQDVIDLTDITIDMSLDVTIAMLSRAMISISSQSGPTHLSVQCGCPSFIYGHEMERHAIDDNPLKAEVVFMETQLGLYNDSPSVLFKDISVMINSKLGGLENDAPIIKKTGINKIGMVGVFDKEGSTNIPFAKSFINMGYPVDGLNYRTIAEETSVEEMNMSIEDFANDFDLIIICKGDIVLPETIKKSRERGAVVCWYMMDSVDHINFRPEYLELARHSNFSVVTSGAVKDLLEAYNIQNVYHILQGIDPREYHPVETETINDVVMIGQKAPWRDEIIKELGSHGIEVNACGPGYSEAVYGDDFNIACCRAKICLNINNTNQNIDSFSDRILRYMATKSCVVTLPSRDIDKYFKNGEDLVWPESNNLLDIIRDLLSHSEKREAIARKGYEKVVNNYTWEHVARQIINIIQPENKGKN